MYTTLEVDEYPNDPRHEFDHLGTMVCFHGRYNLGDVSNPDWDCNSWAEVRSHLEGEYDAALILPLYLLDHSGLTMSTSNTLYAMCDPHGWDWGQVGFIYASAEKLVEEYGPDWDPRMREAAENLLRAEVEEYDAYLRGDVWVLNIHNDEDTIIDSVGGIYGYANAVDEAISQAPLRELTEV